MKACIARQTKQHDFPDKKTVDANYTHDLGNLLKTAGLEIKFATICKKNNYLKVNWNVAKDWKESSRYEKVDEKQARDFYRAVTNKKNGVLQWIKQYW